MQTDSNFHPLLLRKTFVWISVAIIFIFLAVVSPYIMQKQVCSHWSSMSDLITVKIIRNDGTSEDYNSNLFPITNKGDVVIATVPLPADRMMENASLCLNVPHASTRVFYQDELIYSYGVDLSAQGRFIGNTYLRVPLRNEMRGGELRIVLVVVENNAFSCIQNCQLIPQLESIRYFYGQYQAEAPIFIAIGVTFLVVLLFLLLFAPGHPLQMEGIYLSLFCALLSFWNLASRGFFLTLTTNIALGAHLQYITLYLLPIPFCLFMYTREKATLLHRRFAAISTVVFSLFFIIITILNYTSQTIHYSALLLPAQSVMFICMLIFVFLLTRRNYTADFSQTVIRYGVALSMCILALELVRFNFFKFFPSEGLLSHFSLTSMGILVFCGSLIWGYLIQLSDLLSAQNDKALLRRMAYVDVLTGISNRAYCHKQIEEMERSGETHFALLFFDINGLKWANDNYGHDMGDRFIQCVAGILQQIFGQQKFCARWGGDEFVVCLTGKSIHHADDMLRDFDDAINRINNTREFPFKVSVAYGIVRSTEEQINSMDDAIREADRRMYTAKIRMMDNNASPFITEV